ncbi:MAG: four helix bundle protein [Candidatus Margulisiibacteriota bacterium]
MGWGYEKLIVWKNACELRRLIYQTTLKFPSIEMRRISQMRDAARSVKQNIQEGYFGGSLGKYINGINIANGSLAEVQGDIQDCFEDNLINEENYMKLISLARKTEYLLKRLRQSLIRKKLDGTWINY